MLMSMLSSGSAMLLLIDTVAKWMTLSHPHRPLDSAAVAHVVLDELDVSPTSPVVD